MQGLGVSTTLLSEKPKISVLGRPIVLCQQQGYYGLECNEAAEFCCCKLFPQYVVLKCSSRI